MVVPGLYKPDSSEEHKIRPAAHVIGKSSLVLGFKLSNSHVLRFLMRALLLQVGLKRKTSMETPYDGSQRQARRSPLEEWFTELKTALCRSTSLDSTTFIPEWN